MSDTTLAPAQKSTSTANTGKAKAKPTYAKLSAGNNKRSSLEIKGTVATTGIAVQSSKCSCYLPFVTAPDASELFIKVNKNCIVSLSTGLRYDCEGVVAFAVTLV